MSNEAGIFWFGAIAGILALTIILALTGNLAQTNLGPDCRILDDGAAVCLDETAGWYFEPGTF